MFYERSTGCSSFFIFCRKFGKDESNETQKEPMVRRIPDAQPRYQTSENGGGYEVVPTPTVINGDDDDLPL